MRAQPAAKRITTHITDFVIKALDEQTKTEIPATYRVKAVLSKKTFTGQSVPGRPFAFTLGKADTVIINTTAKGYFVMEEVLLVPCDTCANYEHLALMEKAVSEKTVAEKPDSVFRDLKVNDKIRLDNVYFDQSSYILRKESYPQLDKLLNTLNRYPKLVIEIAGHTDNVGDRRLNQSLSENRARVITNYLIQRGIAENRLQFQGYGDNRPAAPNDNEPNKKLNRRVEFTVLQL
ncbi:OmpA family protein [Larkinella rosea]|uniref:OmpA family protein n=1 Tax=Larkinella rosea TaxID=2025312 RepID=UPI001E63444F|nr:OmpA family protein [Larkinella rosea]